MWAPILGPKSAILGVFFAFPPPYETLGVSPCCGSPFRVQKVQFWACFLHVPTQTSGCGCTRAGAPHCGSQKSHFGSVFCISPPYETLGVSPCCGSPFWVQKVQFWACFLHVPTQTSGCGCTRAGAPHFGSKKSNLGSIWVHLLTLLPPFETLGVSP